MGLYDNYQFKLSQPMSMYVGNSLEERGKALNYFATLDEVANQKLDGLQEMISRVPHNKVDEATLSGLVTQANDLLDKRSDGKSLALGYEGISNATKELTRRIKPIAESAAAYQADVAANNKMEGWSQETKNAIHAYNAKAVSPITYNQDGTISGGYTSGYKLPKYEDPIEYMYKQLKELPPNTFKSVQDLKTYLQNSKSEVTNTGISLPQIDATIANLLNGDNPLKNYIDVKTFADTQKELGRLQYLTEDGIQNAINQGKIPEDKVAELMANKAKGISFVDSYTGDIARSYRDFNIKNFLNLGAAKAYTEHTQVQEVGQSDQEKRMLDASEYDRRQANGEEDKRNFELWKSANGIGSEGKSSGATYTGEFQNTVANDYEDLNSRINNTSTATTATMAQLNSVTSTMKGIERTNKNFANDPEYQRNAAKKHELDLQIAIQNERQAMLYKAKREAIENNLNASGKSYQVEYNASKLKAKENMNSLGIKEAGITFTYPDGRKIVMTKEDLADAMIDGRVREKVSMYQVKTGDGTQTRSRLEGTKITTKDGQEIELPLSNPYGRLGTIGMQSYGQRSNGLKKAEEAVAADKSKIMTSQMGIRLSDKYMESIPVNSQNYRGVDGLPAVLPDDWDLSKAKREQLDMNGHFVSVTGIKDKKGKDVGTQLFELPQNSNASREIVKNLASSSDPGYKAMGQLMTTPYYSQLQQLTQGYKSSVPINGVNLHKEGNMYYITDANGNYIPNPRTKNNYYDLEEISTKLLDAYNYQSK